jgi:membrane protease YdiL (CAAX protease family)
MDQQEHEVDHGHLIVFFVLAFALAWALWHLSGVLKRPIPRAIFDTRWLVAQIGVFAPALAALLVMVFEGPRERRNSALILTAVYGPAAALGLFIAGRSASAILDLDAARSVLVVFAGIGVLAFSSPLNRRAGFPGGPIGVPEGTSRWVLFAALAPLALFAVALVLAGISGRSWTAVNLRGNAPQILWNFSLLWCFNLLFGGSLGEELGWRGFALPRLLRRFSPAAASTILGLLWGLWHLPIDISHGFGLPGIAGVALRLGWAWALSALFTWVFIRAGGALLAPLLLHTSFNVLPDLSFPGYERAMYVYCLLVVLLGIGVANRLAVSAPLRHSGPAVSGAPDARVRVD